MHNTPRQLLQRLTVAAAAGQPLPGEVTDWLLDGVEKFTAGRQQLTLCSTLGLVKNNAEQLAKRNHWLCVAGAEVAVIQISTNERARRLALKIKEFEKAAFTQHYKTFSKIQDALYQAKQSVRGDPLPRGIRQLTSILKDSLQGST